MCQRINQLAIIIIHHKNLIKFISAATKVSLHDKKTARDCNYYTRNNDKCINYS